MQGLEGQKRKGGREKSPSRVSGRPKEERRWCEESEQRVWKAERGTMNAVTVLGKMLDDRLLVLLFLFPQ